MAACLGRWLLVSALFLLPFLTERMNFILAFPKEKHDNEEKTAEDKSKNASSLAFLDRIPDKEILKKIRLEMIKQNILNKLQMKCRPPPMYVKRRLVPKPVYEGEISTVEEKLKNQYDRERVEITKIVVPAQKDSRSRCGNNGLCLLVRFSSRLCDNKIIKSARLRLFKTKRTFGSPFQRMVVYEMGAKNNEVRLISKSSVFAPMAGWVSLEMTNLTKEWFARGKNESSENHYLRIECNHCKSVYNFETDHDSGVNPYMEINVRDQKTLKRRKRFLDCRPDTVECCRKLFYVSFAEIGWDDWIIQPVGFDANYCEGTCDGFVSPPNAHQTIIQRVSHDKKTEFSPCCIATDMRPVPLLYFDEEGFIFKRDIPNMTVDSCGCS